MEIFVENKLNEGILAQKEGNFEIAENIYRTILKQNPFHSDANHNLGILSLCSNNSDLALSLFEKAIKSNPMKEQFWLSYINTLVNVLRFDTAIKAINKAKKTGIVGFKLDLLEKHILFKKKKVNNNTSIPTEKELASLLDDYQNGRYKQVEKNSLVLTKKFPNHYFGWKMLGITLMMKGKLSDALNATQCAIILSPKDAESYNNLGNIFKEMKNFLAAEESFREAILLKSDYSTAYSNLGNMLRKLKRLEEAEKIFKKVIQLKPNSPTGFNDLGITQLNKNNFKCATLNFKKAIEIDPSFSDAYNNLGTLFHKFGEHEHAIKHFKKAIEIDSDHIDARKNLHLVSSGVVAQWHLSMMNDGDRNKAYFDAIKLAVNKNTFVLDIGTGSGLLSLMASSSGAKKVITCETSLSIANAAKKIVQENGFSKKIKVINKNSNQLLLGKDLPQKPDLIISEILSGEFVGEGVRNTILDANRRLLKKNGIMIPESGKIKISLIGNSPEVYNNTFVNNVCGFNLSKFNSITQKKFSLHLKEKPLYMSEPEDVFKINLYNSNDLAEDKKTIIIEATQSGICLGIIQWILIRLYKHIEYENKPGENYSHWPTPVYLFDEPVEVKKGEKLELRAILGEDNLWFYKLK